MKLTFWGVRGSLPVPGEETVIYGGNTTCLEVEGVNGDISIIDAGTGIRKLGNDLMRRMSGRVRASLLLTHVHWDHIQGFPFFTPAYVPACTLDIYGWDKALFEQLHQQQRQSDTSFLTRQSLEALAEEKTHTLHPIQGTHTRELLEGQQSRSREYFPISFDQMRAKITTHDLRPHEMIVPGMTISAAYFNELAHPGGMFSYQFTDCGKRLVFTGDYNHDGKGRYQFGDNDRKLIEWAWNADAFVYDAHFTPEEYRGKETWGHSHYEYACELAAEAKIGRLYLTHHAPEHDDTTMKKIEVVANHHMKEVVKANIPVMCAREGMSVEV